MTTTTGAPQGVESFYSKVTNVSDFIWGGTWHGEQVLLFPPMVVILLGVGIWIMIGLRFYPITHLGMAFAGLFKKNDEKGKGEISPFAALSALTAPPAPTRAKRKRPRRTRAPG